jgi:hypothetical protein
MVSAGQYPLLPSQRKTDSRGPDHHLQKYKILSVTAFTTTVQSNRKTDSRGPDYHLQMY